MSSQVYKVFGIPVFEIVYNFDPEEQFIAQNGGLFERDTEPLDAAGEEEWVEEDTFGFR